MKVTDKVLNVDIEYPRNETAPFNTVEVNLLDVRASDGIRIEYDFERDGWIIYQPKIKEEHVRNNIWEHKEEWIESTFLPSWKYEED